MNQTVTDNKCEKAGLAHAWRSEDGIVGFSTVHSETCANCDLKRTKWYISKEGWSYSDGRPNEDTTPIRPV